MGLQNCDTKVNWSRNSGGVTPTRLEYTCDPQHHGNACQWRIEGKVAIGDNKAMICTEPWSNSRPATRGISTCDKLAGTVTYNDNSCVKHVDAKHGIPSDIWSESGKGQDNLVQGKYGLVFFCDSEWQEDESKSRSCLSRPYLFNNVY